MSEGCKEIRSSLDLFVEHGKELTLSLPHWCEHNLIISKRLIGVTLNLIYFPFEVLIAFECCSGLFSSLLYLLLKSLILNITVSVLRLH